MRRLKYLFVLFALFLGCIGTVAQTAFKGQLYINDEHFTLQGKLLRVQLRFSYNDDILNSGETLNVTPILKDGKRMKELSSVIVRGKERGKHEDRNDYFANRMRNNIAVVTADNKQGNRYFVYDTTIPYSEWMGKASLYIESEEHGWGKTPHVYEDLLYSKINIRKMAGSTDDGSWKTNYNRGVGAKNDWVQFMSPASGGSKSMELSGIIPLNDERKIGKMSTKKFNRAVLENIIQSLESQLQIPGTTVKSLNVLGYGAPCGNYKSNESKATQRAYSLKKYLMDNQCFGADGLTVTWMAEDWDTISSRISQSQMKLKTAALDIIKSVPVVKGREDELRILGDGAPYSFLKHYIFPKAERIRFVVQLETSVENSDNNVNDDKQTMSLNSMYATALDFKVGSREFNDIIDLMARLFPDNAESNINAAGVALLRGELGKAEQYLSRWQTNAKAYNNLGVLYMLQGNYPKAEVYLQMAEAAGISQATTALGYLRNIK